MDIAYQVNWRRPEQGDTTSTLRLEGSGILLEPVDGGEPARVPFEEMVGIEFEVDPSGDGRLVLSLPDGGDVVLASHVNRWILSDLVAALFAQRLGGGESRRLLVRARLKPGCAEPARRLLHDGPPFDPAGTALLLHEAFVLEDDVLFLFQTSGEATIAEVTAPDFWQAAGAWAEIVTAVSLVEPTFSWSRSRRPLAAVHPGLGL